MRLESMDHIMFASESNHVKVVYRGQVHCRGGPGGPVKHIILPLKNMWYKKWQSLPYLNEHSLGFGHHNIDHTFEWHKPLFQQDIKIEIKLSKKVGFLRVKKRLSHILKPYVYNWHSPASQGDCMKSPSS